MKAPWIVEGCALYTKRLTHSCHFTERILAPGAEAEEHVRITQALSKLSGSVVLLDERGANMTSKEFSSFLGKRRDRGETLIFVLGGAYGVGADIRAKGYETIALSRMTFPHELCKLVFLEQLYRAYTILEGRGYHH